MIWGLKHFNLVPLLFSQIPTHFHFFVQEQKHVYSFSFKSPLKSALLLLL